MKENEAKTILSIDLRDDETASVTLGGNLDDIIYALVNGVGIVMSNLVEKYPIDVKEKLFNDIKDVIITTIKEDVDYKSYTELDYFD